MALNHSFVRVETWGDWIRARDTFRRWASGEVINRAQDAIYDEMVKAKDELVQHIRSGDLPLAPLTEKYEEYKERHGLDPRILIATSQYINSFDVRRVGTRTWELRPYGSHGDISNEELGQLLEYGSSTMPPRPHWVYVKEKLPSAIRRRLQDEFRDMIGR